MPPTSANRPDHKLAPVRRECLFLMLLLNVLLLFCCDSFLLLFCYYFLLFCWWFHIVIFIIILFLLKNLCSSELIKDGNKERLRQLVPPTHRCFYLALQNRQLMQNMAAGPPPPMVVLADNTLPSYIVDVIFCLWNILSRSDFDKQLYSSHISWLRVLYILIQIITYTLETN